MTSEFENLKQEIEHCRCCALSQSRKHVIFGEGNPRAGVLFIGEAPGREEDNTGRPFVGKSGQLLDKILDACGFEREKHIFISNIVRCRPPDNRVPLEEEAKICIQYLFKQIECINPEILVFLGSTALKYMMGDGYRITRIHGEWLKWNSRFAMAVYHPAALLRNPALKRPAWEDYKKIVYKYRELINPEHFSAHV